MCVSCKQFFCVCIFHLWFICSSLAPWEPEASTSLPLRGRNMLPWHISPHSRAKHSPTHKAAIVFHALFSQRCCCCCCLMKLFAGRRLVSNVTYAAQRHLCFRLQAVKALQRSEVRGHKTGNSLVSFSTTHQDWTWSLKDQFSLIGFFLFSTFFIHLRSLTSLTIRVCAFKF